MELSASYKNTEIHILGYFMDYHNKVLEDALAVFREKRRRRAERIVDKLNRMNIPLTIESVLASATGDSIGRPHIANALVSEGHLHKGGTVVVITSISAGEQIVDVIEMRTV